MAFSNPQKNLEQVGIADGMSIADIGAGSGFYTIASAQINKTGKIYAVDVQDGLLARVKNAAHQAGLHNIEVIHGDAERVGGTRLREFSIDIVLACNILFQVEHKQEFAKEIKRILKPGARVLIVDWTESFGGLGPQPEHVVSLSDATTLFESAGFTKVKDFDAGDHHYGLILRTS